MANHKPRIRSIKPEFWTDKKIAKLPKPTALFFISLWNFADDQGVIEDDSTGIALRVPIFRSQDISKMLQALWSVGLIARAPICDRCFITSSAQCEGCLNTKPSPDDTASLTKPWAGDGLVFIRGWKHQKIDRPSDGKWKRKKINWLMHCGSPMPSEESSTGSDRIGSDQTGGEGSETPPILETEVEEAGRYYAAQFAAKEKSLPPPIREVDRESLREIFKAQNPRISLEGMKRLISMFIWMEEPFFDRRGRSLQLLEKEFTKVWARAANASARGVA